MQKIVSRILLIVIIITGLAVWCCKDHKSGDGQDKIIIGISKYIDNDHYTRYAQWLQAVDSNIILIDLYHIPIDSALLRLEECSALLLSGGADVHPGFYNRDEDTALCSIDFYRDTLEMALIGKALEADMPILGICRGLQILNVYFGGSLYADIPSQYSDSLIHRNDDKDFDASHPVSVSDRSWLFHLNGGISSDTVNSSHHQGIRELGEGLFNAAWADDGLIEAIHRIDTAGSPFLMAVQWHPERMRNGHSFSAPLAKRFVKAAKQYQTDKYAEKK